MSPSDDNGYDEQRYQNRKTLEEILSIIEKQRGEMSTEYKGTNQDYKGTQQDYKRAQQDYSKARYLKYGVGKHHVILPKHQAITDQYQKDTSDALKYENERESRHLEQLNRLEYRNSCRAERKNGWDAEGHKALVSLTDTITDLRIRLVYIIKL